MSGQLYTHADVAQHNKRDDLWMIVDKKVYNVTKFIDEHPGGDELLLDEGAKDATQAFEDVGHTNDAREILERYYIGDLDPTSTPVAVQSPNGSPAKQAKGNPLRVIIPVVFFIGYFYWRFFILNANATKQ
ncbi:cytochrome b5-like heme/steroid binding domain-containing protein [Mycotypha africana]|uniref:cytochrome b5-like heme/steroid binding domain-containing protein n=1 Tax=Mycotypha africana TaxID=64632 RepID=UPI0022FFEB46|nr:cytochrome b5-like heme/steroid binding domain-containing protein [Mycotypha africana]KAI8970074.1 cytochrome b5-like heme/steroid binding domain-containing protein [Mycotypha africana]